MSVSRSQNKPPSFPTLHAAGTKDSKYGGRKFAPAERQLSCLEQLWEGIKNFFACLCYCCSSGNELDVIEDDPTLSLLGIQVEPLNITPPTIEPAKDKIEDPKTGEEKPPYIPHLFQPLEELKKQREGKVGYAPPPPVTIVQAKDLAVLGEIKETLGEPAIKDQTATGIPLPIRRIREGIVAKLSALYQEILAGNVKLSAGHEEKNFTTNCTHPSHLQTFIKFLTDHLDQYNLLLEQRGATKIDHDEVFAGYHEIESLYEVWNALSEIAESPFLQKEHLAKLKAAVRSLADISPIQKKYPLIMGTLKTLASAVGNKWTIEKCDADLLAELKDLFASKFDSPFLPTPAKEVFEAHQIKFLLGLKKESAELKIGPGIEPATALGHIELIQRYIEQEVELCNDAMAKFLAQYPELGVIDAIDPQHYAEQIVSEAKSVLVCRNKIEQLHLSDLGIDDKIALLTELAISLPQNDSTVWIGCSEIREEIIKIYGSLFADKEKFFSDYRFEKVDTNKAKFDADIIRKSSIDSALELIANKLGCPKPDPSEIFMDTSSDPKESEAAREREFDQHANRINELYAEQKEALGHKCAIEQVEQYIRNCTSALKEEDEKHVYMRNIILRLGGNLMNPISQKMHYLF